MDRQKVATHRDLLAWQRAILLVRTVYEITDQFPDFERFELSKQIRRAAVSVPSNIAEGAARASRREFARFVGIARGSLSELETQLIVGEMLGYLHNARPIMDEVDSLKKLLNGLHRSLRSKYNQDD